MSRRTLDPDRTDAHQLEGAEIRTGNLKLEPLDAASQSDIGTRPELKCISPGTPLLVFYSSVITCVSQTAAKTARYKRRIKVRFA